LLLLLSAAGMMLSKVKTNSHVQGADVENVLITVVAGLHASMGSAAEQWNTNVRLTLQLVVPVSAAAAVLCAAACTKGQRA
jgi:hypothetical protein